jgi:glycosyltransferase involved in cell wall biosynthesis
MRCLHVVPSYLPATRYGGPIFAVHGLCRALVARGHDVEVLTTNVDGPGDSAVPLVTPVTLDGVQVRYFPSRALRRLYWSPPLARAMHRGTHQFDVVHLHSVFLWPTWAAARFARGTGIPYVISPRGMLVKELIARRNRIIKLMWNNLIERRNIESAAAIHATSALEAEELKRFGWRLPPVEVIPNAVDQIQPDGIDVSDKVKEISAQEPLILFLGRISWKKGLDRLLQAFARTQSGTLAIVGPDDEGLSSSLTKLAAKLGISNRVQILPRIVLGADKEHLYRSARVFVLPSYSENFGTTVLEAMQHGVAVVATPEVGAAEIVRQSGAGIVAAGEPEPFGNAITALIEEPDLCRRMGRAGRHHVALHHTWASVAAQMEALYSSLSR